MGKAGGGSALVGLCTRLDRIVGGIGAAGAWSGRTVTRGLAVAALIAAGLFAGGAQAQTTFVSNTGQTATSNAIVGAAVSDTFRQAQKFTTGGATDGYLLKEVVVSLGSIESGAIVQASIYTASSGAPGSSLYTLTNPTTLAADSDNTFTAPARARLTAATDYFVVFENGNNTAGTTNVYRVRTMDTNTLDSGAASGWSIENERYAERNSEGWSSTTNEMLIAIRGTSNIAATGAPTISGVPQVGERLTAGTSGIRDGDGLTRVRYRYQWQRETSRGVTQNIGTNSSRYTVTAADLGKRIRVRVTFVDNNGYSEQLDSDYTEAVESAPARGRPSISGRPQAGETLTADLSGIRDADGLPGPGAFSYQWIRVDGRTEAVIPGATGATFVPAAADVGKQIKVRASFTDLGNNDEAVTSGAYPKAGVPSPAIAPAQGACPAGNDWCTTMTVGRGSGTLSNEYGYDWVVYYSGSTWKPGYGSLADDTVGEGEDAFYTVMRLEIRTDLVALLVGPGESLPFGTVLNVGGHEFTTAGRFQKGPPRVQVWPRPRGLSVTPGQKVRVGLTLPPSRQAELRVFDAEGHEDDGTIEFTVKLWPAATAAVTVDYATGVNPNVSDVDKATSRDYTATSGTLTFAAGETEKTVSVPLIDDTIRDDGESFRLNLSNATGARIAALFGIGTIRNTEGPLVSVADASAAEGSAVSFTVSLSEAGSEPATVAYATSGDTATSGTDFTAASGTLTFAAGETSKTVSVATTDDASEEEDETFTLTLSSPTNLRLGTATATGTIEDDDEAAGLTASFTEVPASHDGSSAFTLRLAFSEAIVTSFRVLRDEALTVTGGTVVEAKRVERRSDLWNIRVEPDGNDAVTVTLPATTGACGATGAICAAGSVKLSGAAEAVVAGPPVTPLTASLSEAPAEHDGSSAFTLKLTFSEEPDGLGFRTVRDNLFTVSGGEIVRTKRTGENSNLGFRLTVEPSGNAAVTLSLATPLPACNQSGAVCTADGRSLTGPVTATVQGPPALSVADAEVAEGPNASLAFAVSLGRAASGTVTVDYATSGVTATAGDDYTATSGTLTFSAGETSKTVSVPVLDDAHDDDGETLTLTLTNATGAWIEDGTATGTIRNSDAMPRAWLARFGRTVADQVIEAVEGRMAAARSPGAEVSVGGQKIGGGAAADDLESREAAAFGFRPVTARDLMTGSSFELTGGTAEGGFGAVWGRGAVTRFDGVEGELTLDGEVASGMVGVDFTRGRSMVGLAVAHSRGEGGYRSPSGNGEVESSLTGLYPWGRYAVSERLTVWGMAGYGSGTLTLTPEGMPAMETDMDLAMGAVGGRGVLVKAAAEGGLELAAKTDALLVRTTSDEMDGSAATLASEANVTRVRLGLEGTWRGIGTGGGGSLVPTLEVGVRQDGGDAETGSGMDIGAGLSWTQPSLGIRAEVSGRALLTHAEEGFRERGFAGSLAWDPNQDSERGPSLTLSQNVGASATGGMDALLNHRTLEGLAANDGSDGPDRRHLELKLGYGLAAFGDRFTSTPELGLGLTDAGREVSLGWRLARDRQSGDSGSAELLLEGRRRESANHRAEAEHSIGFRATVRF